MVTLVVMHVYHIQIVTMAAFMFSHAGVWLVTMGGSYLGQPCPSEVRSSTLARLGFYGFCGYFCVDLHTEFFFPAETTVKHGFLPHGTFMEAIWLRHH